MFDSETGPVNYGFFKDKINAYKTDNYIPNSFDGFRYAGKAAEKMQSGLTPQDLLLRRNNLTSVDIVTQLAQKLGNNHPLVNITKRVASGEEFPLRFPALENISETAFRDYFCEILQPIALQTGQFKGNAGDAAEIFLGGDFSNTMISFDAAKNAGLCDSILTTSEGKFIKISTKGGSSGAHASAKNLIDSIQELSATPAGTKLLKKYKDVIQLIRDIQTDGQVKAPLSLGVKFGIITSDEADAILGLKSMGMIRYDDIDKLKISKNLKKLAKTRTTKDPENLNLFYHLVACVAYPACEKVNEETDFSKAASDILNNGALVQVYTKLSAGSKEWTLNQFETVYPSENIAGVLLTASKNYYSTGIKGNFTFQIKKAGEPTINKADDSPEQIHTTFSKKKTAKVKDSEHKEPKGVGREKRKPVAKKKAASKVGRAKRK